MNDYSQQSLPPVTHDDIEYRPFNPLAMLALVLALLSCFSIATIYLVPLSFLAGILALIAARQSAGERGFSGGRVAAVALFLAIVTGVTSLTYHLGRESYVKNTARGYSMLVMQELANGRPEHALSYGVDYDFRMPPGTDLKEHFQSVGTTEKSGRPCRVNV